jgi:hypothetical protein
VLFAEPTVGVLGCRLRRLASAPRTSVVHRSALLSTTRRQVSPCRVVSVSLSRTTTHGQEHSFWSVRPSSRWIALHFAVSWSSVSSSHLHGTVALPLTARVQDAQLFLAISHARTAVHSF